MSTLNVPAINIPIDTTVFGPIPTGVGLNRFLLTLDIANLVAPCTFIVEIALDGLDWHKEAIVDVVGLGIGKNGVLETDLGIGGDLGTVSNDGGVTQVKVKTTSSSLVRLTTINNAAFHSNGGTLVVS